MAGPPTRIKQEKMETAPKKNMLHHLTVFSSPPELYHNTIIPSRFSAFFFPALRGVATKPGKAGNCQGAQAGRGPPLDG